MIRPIADRRHDAATVWATIERRWEFEMRGRRLEIERNHQLLGALEVHSVIERGFAVLTHRGSDRPISSINEVETGAAVEAFVSDGAIDLTVAARRAAVGGRQ